jgi:parallel beta helix pectate lyase-like protein/IPT/TIG domain-containing protein
MARAGRAGSPTSLVIALSALLLVATIAPSMAAGTGQPSPAPHVLFASPNGTGTACSEGAPCSLTGAQQAAEALVPTMESDIDVQLEGGVYTLTAPLTLGPRDGGIHGFHVVYEPAPGAHPVLSGAQTITRWTAGPQAGVWHAPVSFDTRQLYVDGQSVPLASGLPANTSFVQTPSGFTMTSTVMDSWPDPTNIAAVFTFGDGVWTQTSCNVASISGLTITMAEPCWDNLHMPSEGVQEAGWVVSPDSGFPGLSPKKTPNFFQDGKTVLAPALQTLIRVDDTSNLSFSGLTFSYGGWTGPDTSDGFAQMQADWTLTGPHAASSEGTCSYSNPPGTCPFASWTRTPANVVLTNTRNVEVTGNTFTHLGGAGLDIYRGPTADAIKGAQGDLVKGNEFTDIAASAIQLGSTDDVDSGDISDNTITDNYIHDVANQYLGGVGIWLGYSRDTTVSHNQLDDLPYTGISIGWGGWHTDLANQTSDQNMNSHNAITDNIIYNYMTTLGDGGAVYTNGPQATGWGDELELTGNIAYLGNNTDFTFYTDTGSDYVDIEDNLDYFQPVDSFDSGGCHTIGHIELADNAFANGGPAYPCFPYTDVNSADNATICENPTPAQVQPAVRILEGAGLDPGYRALLDRRGPAVTLVGPGTVRTAGGDRILISGTGFDPSSTVSVGGRPATGVQVLSANYIEATTPPGSGVLGVAVTTPEGTSEASTADQVTYQTSPSQCTDYTGSGISTTLLAG